MDGGSKVIERRLSMIKKGEDRRASKQHMEVARFIRRKERERDKSSMHKRANGMEHCSTLIRLVTCDS